jgi:hypothetical protein
MVLQEARAARLAWARRTPGTAPSAVEGAFVFALN